MPKKKRREKEKREKADRDKVELDAMNASRLANGHKPLECLPLGFYPNMTFAPSLVAPSPNEGTPLKVSSGTTTLERPAERIPLKGSKASATLKGTSLEREHPQASPEEETVLDTTLYAAEEEDSASELDWGNDTVIASAILGMSKLEGPAASEDLAPPTSEDWTFDEPPRSGRVEGDGAMVLSSAGSHMIWVPNQELVRKSPPVLRARAPSSVFEDERNHDVDYTDDSPNEDDGATLESSALLSEDNIIQHNSPAISQNNPPTTVVQAKNGKDESEPDARLVVGAGATTIAKRNQVLTQAIMLDLAAAKQIRLRTSLLDHTQQQAGLEEDIYNYDELDGYTSPGGTIRMDKKLATVVFIAVAAETPNKQLLKARQEAYEQVTTQATELLEKQRKAYEDQCARMAEEHQRSMKRMKAESDKMIEEASKVRQE
jgi:hypothetical protein